MLGRHEAGSHVFSIFDHRNEALQACGVDLVACCGRRIPEPDGASAVTDIIETP